MTKQEFVDRVASKTGGSRKDAAEAVDAVLDSIQEILTQGGEINFTGFGKFSTQHRKERQGVNPRNPSQKVAIPAATVPKFSAGSSLRSAKRLRKDVWRLEKEREAFHSDIEEPLEALERLSR